MIPLDLVKSFVFSLGTTDCECLSYSEVYLGSHEAIGNHNPRIHIR